MLVLVLLAGAVLVACVLPRWRTPRACLLETLALATLHGLSTSGLLQRQAGLPQVSVAFILVAYFLARLQATYRQRVSPSTLAHIFSWRRKPVAKATTDTDFRAPTDFRVVQPASEIPCIYLIPVAALSLTVLAGFRDTSWWMPLTTGVVAYSGAQLTLLSWRRGMAMLMVALGFGVVSVMYVPDENLVNELIVSWQRCQ